jgi:hypothetical protein
MQAQLAEAQAAAVDVLWFTDHDWRLSQYGYRRVVHFNAFSEGEDGLSVSWSRKASGSFAAASGSIVSSPVSPLDPSGGKALRISGTSPGTATGFSVNRYQLNDTSSRQNTTGTLVGVALEIEVQPQAFSLDSFAEILVGTSFRPAIGGRPAGRYQISYRLGGPGTPGTAVLDGTGIRALTGIVTLAANAGQWNSLRLEPAADLARLWPDLPAPDDAGLVELDLGVASRRGSPAVAVFDYLRFSRGTTGAAAIDAQRRLSSELAGGFPGITQHNGLEVSLTDGHINWFGGEVSPFDYTGQKILPPSRDTNDLIANIGRIHDAHGLASYNHMFGSGSGPAVSKAAQDSRRVTVARMLLDTTVLGADMLEIYRRRNGVDLDHHLQAWDVCSRNGMFVTGTGVNDNHGGRNWAGELNNFVTWTWAASPSETDLLASFAAGRTYFGDLTKFRGGSLDLLVDGACPMGSVSVTTAPSRQLRISAASLPASGAVRVVQGAVDYANTEAPLTLSRTTIPADRFATGQAEISVANGSSSFVRTEVLDGSGAVIAASNPVWMLRTAPAGGIPIARRVA